MHKRKSEHGVITVLVSLLLVGILSLGTLTIETGRLQAAKTQLQEANISAGTSMIASYNSRLYQRYGLLAIDQKKFSETTFRHYLEFNSDLAQGYKGNNISTMYTIDSSEVSSLYNLANPAVLKRQILSRARYHVVPQDYVLNYYTMNYFWKDIDEKITYLTQVLSAAANGSANAGSLNDISADMRSALASLHDQFKLRLKLVNNECSAVIDSASVALLPSRNSAKIDQIPQEDLDAIDLTTDSVQSILGDSSLLISTYSGSTYTEHDAYLDVSCISDLMAKLSLVENLPRNAQSISKAARDLLQNIKAAYNMLMNIDAEGNLLLNSYIANFFPNRNYNVEGYYGPSAGTQSSSNFVRAAMEYVFSGSTEEKKNQEEVNKYIVALRMVNNLYATITNSKNFNSNNMVSVAAHVAWAYYESCADMHLLTCYNAEVAMNKYDMIFPIANPNAVVSAFRSFDAAGFEAGIKNLGFYNETTKRFVVEGLDKCNYRDMLSIAAWFVPNTKKLHRVGDLIQLEMRYTESKVNGETANFQLSNQNTFVRVKCTAKLNSVLPVIAPEGTGSLNMTKLQSIKYVGY